MPQDNLQNSGERGPQGRYNPLYPGELGRSLFHPEMDYNLDLIGQVIHGYRVMGTNNDGTINVTSDVDKVLKLHLVTSGDIALILAGAQVGDYVWIPTIVTQNVGPQGNQGFQGPQGFQGRQGPQGNQGRQGPQGNQGNQGPSAVGAPGEPGIDGPQGFQGNLGPQGNQGPQGFQGSTGNYGGDSLRFLVGNYNGSSAADGAITFSNTTTLPSVITVIVSNTDADGGSTNTWFQSMVALKGSVRITRPGRTTEYLDYVITNGSVTSATSLSLAYVGGTVSAIGTSWPVGTELIISYAKTGLKGDQGFQGPQGNDGTGSSFQYARTLFVDPNGDDGIALPGRLDFPWQNISSAINYLETEELLDWTIWVFPGEYIEEFPWVFQYSRNTTIKLNGNVNILFNLRDTSQSLINGLNNFSIVADERGGIDGTTGAIIRSFNTNEGVVPPLYLFLLNGNDKSHRISNVSLLGSDCKVGFGFESANGTSLKLSNVYQFALRYNVYVRSESSTPKISVKNSIFTCGDLSIATQYANINILDNFETPPLVDYFNGIWNFENVKFINYSTGTASDEKAHISSDNRGVGTRGMYVTINNCCFYSNSHRKLDIWYEKSTGRNKLEILGTSIANSEEIYFTNTTPLEIYGTSSYIQVDQDIIDPTLLGI